MRDSKAGKFVDNIAFVDFSLLGVYSQHTSHIGYNSHMGYNGRLADLKY